MAMCITTRLDYVYHMGIQWYQLVYGTHKRPVVKKEAKR
jgi:hypothetical protein